METEIELKQIHKTLLRVLFGTKEVLNLEEVSQYTGLSKSYLTKLTANRKIPFSKPTGKLIWIKKADIDQFLLSNPILPGDDIEEFAINYIANKPLKRGNW